jgi:hypothetical protein
MVVVVVTFLTVTRAWCNTFQLQEIKKIIFNNHTHEHVTQVISVGLLEFAFDYSHPMCSFYSNVLG